MSNVGDNTFFKKLDVTQFAVLISLVFSIWCIVVDDVINSDGILYLETARYFLEGNWAAAYQHYNWPFYSALIALVSAITPLSLEHSAFTINVFFQCLIVYMFLAILKELGASKQVLIAGAVLLLANVNLNEYRDYIIRDFGYWGMYLTAIWLMIRFKTSGHLRYALGWNLAIILASLFRVEGLVFLLFAPLILLFVDTHGQGRFSATVKCYSLTIVVMVTSLLWVMLSQSGFTEFGRLIEPVQKIQFFIDTILTTIPAKADQLSDVILNRYSESYGIYGVWALLLTILVMKILDMTGWLALLLLFATAFGRKIRQQVQQYQIIMGFIVINFAVISLFLISNFYLVGRFVIALALLLLMFAAFALSYFYRWTGWQTHRRLMKPALLRGALVLVVFAMLVDGLVSFGSSKHYIRDAAQWLEDNTAAEASLYSNNMPLYFYSGRWADKKALAHARNTIEKGTLNRNIIRQYDYMAIRVSRKQQALRQQLQKLYSSHFIYEAKNERGDAVMIFQINL